MFEWSCDAACIGSVVFWTGAAVGALLVGFAGLLMCGLYAICHPVFRASGETYDCSDEMADAYGDVPHVSETGRRAA